MVDLELGLGMVRAWLGWDGGLDPGGVWLRKNALGPRL